MLKILLFLLFPILLPAQKSEIPFEVAPLFDFSQPETLGLEFAPGCESFTIFSPTISDTKYNHGVVLYPFKDKLYAMWQGSSVDEDGADTRVFYSSSENGEDWSSPAALTNIWKDGIKTGGGWWSEGDTLVAFICVWPEIEGQPKEGYTDYLISTDGDIWSEPKRVTDYFGNPVMGIIEQDLHALPDGRIITAFHMQPGLIATPYYTDDQSGVSGWRPGKMENLPSKTPEMSREIEPSWFYRHDGAVVMIFRDQNSTFQKLAAISYDRGETWSQPRLVNTPDSRAKQSAGNFHDGTAYMVNNPSGSKTRYPLVITISDDGYVFDRAYLIRSGGGDLQPQRYEGKYKRAGYSYPKSVIWKEYLYIGYATNKEDVEYTRIPINLLTNK